MSSRWPMDNVLLWNCRRLESISVVNALRCIVINEHPFLVFLQETKLNKVEMEKVRLN